MADRWAPLDAWAEEAGIKAEPLGKNGNGRVVGVPGREVRFSPARARGLIEAKAYVERGEEMELDAVSVVSMSRAAHIIRQLGRSG